MKKVVLALTLFTLLLGCVREINDLSFTHLKPGISIPIGKFTLGADNLTKLGDSLDVRVGESNVLEFYYNSELLRSTLNDRFIIKDQSFGDQLPFNSFVFIAGQTNEVKASDFNSFTISNTDLPDPAPSLKRIIFKGGIISINQSKDFDHEVVTVISFPKLTKNGVPLSMTVSGTSSQSEALSGYELLLTGPTGVETNTLEYGISTTISNTGSSSSGTISFNFGMTSMEFSYLEGDFKSYDFDFVEGIFDLGLPENEVPDNVGFTNPSVSLTVDNSAGIEFGLTIDEVSVERDDGNRLFVTGTYDNDFVLISQASTAGESSTSGFSISNQNTDNLIELLSDIPKSALFKGTATANPNWVFGANNFVTDSSEVIINAELVLPLEGYADNYALIDTLRDVGLQVDEDGVVGLNDVNLRMQIENNFPFEISLQLYFLDSTAQQNVIDSLFTNVEDQKIIPAANVDASGLVISPTIKITDIGIDNALYEKIQYAKSIILEVYIRTPGADASPRKGVKFTTTNYLSVSIGISASALIDLNNIDSRD